MLLTHSTCVWCSANSRQQQRWPICVFMLFLYPLTRILSKCSQILCTDTTVSNLKHSDIHSSLALPHRPSPLVCSSPNELKVHLHRYHFSGLHGKERVKDRVQDEQSGDKRRYSWRGGAGVWASGVNERRVCLRLGTSRKGEWEMLKEVIHLLCISSVRKEANCSRKF